MILTKGELRNIRRGLFFTSPWIIGILFFVLYPLVASLYYSFTDFSVLLPPVNIGLQNYKDLALDDLFWKSLYNTFFYAAISLPLGLCIAILIAVLLNEPLKFRGTFRVIYFIPSLVPLVPLAILWQWIFNGHFGILNAILNPILKPSGLAAPNWLGDPSWTKPALICTRLWGIGGTIVIFLAALQEVPKSFYESAEIDGASPFKKFFYITLPLISPAIYFNLIVGIIMSLQVFAIPYVMFGRGPANSTYFFTMYIYDNAFKYLKMGYASAMAWILFILILALTLLAAGISKKYIFYSGEQSR
jgi:multiple sugar transport system permease protein